MSFNKSDFFNSNGLVPASPTQHQERVNRTFRGDREKYFGKPKPAAPPPPPVIEDTDGRRQDEADRIRMRRGRASAYLAGNTGAPLTASKVLLGG